MESLQRFADALVQAAAANRVQLFVQDFANLVVGERETCRRRPPMHRVRSHSRG